MKAKISITMIALAFIFGAAALTVAAPDSGRMRFTLTDGSVFYGRIATNAIPVQTEFGRVNVPVRTIRAIEKEEGRDGSPSRPQEGRARSPSAPSAVSEKPPYLPEN